MQATRHFFLSLPFGPLLTGEALRHVEFQGAPEDAKNWFVGSADIKNAFHQMRILGWLQAFFALLAVLPSEVGYTEVSLARRESRTDFPEGYVTTFGSLGMEIGGGPWFWREENITVLEAHSILYAVRYAERNHPPGLIVPVDAGRIEFF